MRTAIVTGASGALGAAVSAELLAAGWSVVAVSRRAPGEQAGLRWIKGDAGNPRDAEMVVEQAGPVDALACLAGGFSVGALMHETPVAEFESQFTANVRSAYVICAAALPGLMAGDGGAIVCVSSRAVERPFAGAAGYIASKAALLGLVDVLSAEYAPRGVRTNAVVPGVIDTPANRAAQPSADRGDWVAPEEIARVIGFLLSADSRPITGARVPVSGVRRA